MSHLHVAMAAMDTADRGGRRGSLASLPSFGKSKSTVDIVLNDEQKGCFVPSYTTLEKIQGTVLLKCPVDIPFDDIHITFQGSSRTYVEKLATSAPTNPRSQAFHNFLRLSQPIKLEDLPEDKVAKAGVVYTFPFTFVVPEQLLPQACNHKFEHLTVHEAHLALPPSLGDPMMAGDGKSLLDDMSPGNTIISYGLRVFMYRRPGPGHTRPTVLVDRIKKLRIIPAVDEAAPLRVLGGKVDDFAPIKTKSLKKGMFKGKLGSLTVEAVQPKALMLHGLRSTSSCPVTTMTNVRIRFDPVEQGSKPPRLGSLFSKIKVVTCYSSVPMRSFPPKIESYHFDSQKGAHVDTITLSCRNVESVQWDRHTSPGRHGSADSLSDAANLTASYSSSSATSDSSASPENTSLPYYTANILVPIDLPTTCKTFVPTFHSCLVSRMYVLDLVLSVHSASPTVSASTLHLKVPLQIAAEGNADAAPIISAEEAASIARREADGVFVPRSFSVPGRDSQDTGRARGAMGSVFTASRVGSLSSQRASVDGRHDSVATMEETAMAPPPGYSAFVMPLNRPVAG